MLNIKHFEAARKQCSGQPRNSKRRAKHEEEITNYWSANLNGIFYVLADSPDDLNVVDCHIDELPAVRVFSGD